MAEKAAQSYHVRLIKGFNVAHRRAGYTFAPGPVPQVVELNSEQLEAIKGDAAFEILSDKDGSKLVKEYSLTPSQEGSTDELQDPANIEGEKPGATTQASGAHSGPDSLTAMENGKNRVVTDDSTDEDADELPELSTDRTRAELNQVALDAGITSPDKIKGGKEAVVEAIVAARAEDEPADDADDDTDEQTTDEDTDQSNTEE